MGYRNPLHPETRTRRELPGDEKCSGCAEAHEELTPSLTLKVGRGGRGRLAVYGCARHLELLVAEIPRRVVP